MGGADLDELQMSAAVEREAVQTVVETEDSLFAEACRLDPVLGNPKTDQMSFHYVGPLESQRPVVQARTTGVRIALDHKAVVGIPGYEGRVLIEIDLGLVSETIFPKVKRDVGVKRFGELGREGLSRNGSQVCRLAGCLTRSNGGYRIVRYRDGR